MAKLNHYVGSFANDAAADAAISAASWTKYEGIFYLNTTTNLLRFWDNTQWSELGSGGVAQWTETGVLHVSKGGNDANAGTSVNLAKLTIGSALGAASSGDVILVHPGTYQELITPVNGVVVRGMDPDQVTLSAPTGIADTIGTVGAGVDFTLAHIGLLGKLVLSGNAAILRIKERCDMDGNIDIAAGDGDTGLYFDESDIFAGSSPTYDGAITIGVTNAFVQVNKSSRVSGYQTSNGGGNDAIYWNAANDNVRCAFSELMGTRSSSSNPFGRSATQTPTFRAHHCSFNTDPETGGIWTNEVSIGQRYNSLENSTRTRR